LPALKFAARINGATGLVLTKLDVLSDLGPIKVATSYRSEEQRGLNYSDAYELFSSGRTIYPSYQEFPEVKGMPAVISRLEDLDSTFRSMIDLIEQSLEIPVTMISFGKERGQELNL
jgi:adenylosuccinate synthase